MLLCGLLPSAAVANTQAPANDNFLDADNLNSPGTPVSVNTLQSVRETIGATVQSNVLAPCGMDICQAGPPEIDTCQGVSYGKTLWYDFYPDHDGQIEIQTIGIPNVIALYTYDPQTLLPTRIQCAPGSDASSNELSAPVRRGVDYTFQIGGRGDAGGSIKMLFNYSDSGDLTVAPFLASPTLLPIATSQFRLLRLKFIGLTSREKMSAACASCSAGALRINVGKGNTAVLSTRSAPVFNRHTRFLISATAPAQIGRFKLYGYPTRHRWPVIAAGCLAPGVVSVTSQDAAHLGLLKQVPCPTPLVNPVGGEYVFWQGMDGGLWQKTYANGRWTRAIELKVGKLGSAPAVAVHANGERDVFWKGPSGNLWEAYYTGVWTVTPLGAGQLGSAPTVGVDAAGDEYVFWQGTDAGLWEMSYAAGRWSRAIELNAAGRLGSAPAVAVRADGEQDVFWKGILGNLWEMSYTDGWGAPRDIGGGELGLGPSVGVDGAGNEHVFWRGLDGGLWEQSNLGAGWSQATPLNAGRLGSAPTVAVHADGEQDVFWKGAKGNLWEMRQIASWQPSVKLGSAQLGSAPSAGVDAAGKQPSP